MKNLMLVSVESFDPVSIISHDFEGIEIRAIDTPDTVWIAFYEVWLAVLSDVEGSPRSFLFYVDAWISRRRSPLPAIVYGHTLYFEQQAVKACLDTYRKQSKT